MKISKNNIFLIDGIGAILSAGFTGYLLPRYSLFLGLPVALLQALGLIALMYAAGSLSFHFWVKNKKSWMLLAVLLANLFYCLISVSLIFGSERITWRGKAVLAAEIVVVLLVVSLEFWIYRKKKSQEEF